MSPSHLALAFLVVAGWGLNFVFIRIGLDGLPPLLLCALRFFFSAVPLIFFFPRPKVPFHQLFAYGMFTFALQFSFLFLGMNVGMPPGLASLLMQIQAFFTLGLAVVFLGERPGLWKVTGALISFSGIGIVAHHSGVDVTLPGLLLTVAASFCWASGNIFSKKMGAVSPLSMVAWGSLIATPFVAVVSFVVDGPELIFFSLSHLSWAAGLSLAYIVYVSTLVCYSLWSFLLHRYPVATIGPFTLLVPVFGFLGAVVAFHEPFPAWKLGASALVILGLCFNLLEPRLKAMWMR